MHIVRHASAIALFLGFWTSCHTAHAQVVGKGASPSGWKVDLDETFRLYDQVDAEMRALIPSLVKATQEIDKACTAYEKDGSEEAWTQMVGAAIDHISDLKSRVANVVNTRRKLDQKLKSALSKAKDDSKAFEHQMQSFKADVDRLSRDKEGLDKETVALRRKKREAIRGGAPLSEEEEEAWIEAKEKFYQHKESIAEAEDRITNLELEQRLLAKARKNFLHGRGELVDQGHKGRSFAGNLDSLARKLGIFLRYRDMMELSEAVEKVGESALEFDGEWSSFRDGMAGLIERADPERDGRKVELPPADEDELIRGWIDEAEPKTPSEPLPETPTAEGGEVL